MLYLLFLSSSDQLLKRVEGKTAGVDDIEQCSNILLLAAWDSEDADAIFQAMNELLGMLGFAQVVRRVGGSSKGSASKVDELDSYEALVREVG